MNAATIEKGSNSKKRAIVLSGGGGRGAFEYGVLEKLDELGWHPDVLVGTSIGSVNAAVYAVGGIAAVKKMWNEIRNRDMHRFFRYQPWRSLLDRRAWKQTLEKYANEDHLKQASKALYIVSMDIKTGHPVVYTNSTQFDPSKKIYCKVDDGIKHIHLMASSAIPYVYERAMIEEIPHWDGAVMYNSPLQPAVDSGADQVMIVLLSPYHPGREGALPPAPSGMLGKAGYLFDLVLLATFENDFEHLWKINQRVREGRTVAGHREVEAALIGPKNWLPIQDILRYRQDRIEYLHQKGREAVEETWERIEQRRWDSM